MDTMSNFKTTLLIMLFYSVCITMLTHTMPADSLDYVTGFSDLSGNIDLETISGDVQDSLESQTNIPVIELGALVFYSGNILIDLLLNWAFAIPEMFGLLISGVMLLFSVDSGLAAMAQLFASACLIVFYFMSVIQLLAGIRSGRIV